MLADIDTSLHNAIADDLELLSVLNWIDPFVAALEQVRRPFGCQILAIALDSKLKPADYERLLKRNGIRVLGIELFGLETMTIGNFIVNGCACMTIKKRDEKRAVKLLRRHDAVFAY